MIKRLNKIFIIVLLAVIALIIPDDVSARDKDGDIVVIIDPGHGGKDGGACQNGLIEKVVNWNISVGMKAELETYAGVKVYLTRGYGEWFSNTGRGRYGNLLGADIFICVHNNSGSETASGADIYGTVNAEFSPQMRILSDIIFKKYSEIGLGKNNGYCQRASSTDPTMDFFTALDEATKMGIPSMLIEHCFLSNPNDAAFIAPDAMQYKVGAAGAAGIAEYYGLQKRTVNANSEISLIRTYSAQFSGVNGTFSSSNEEIAYVSTNGLITAVGEGTAVISCTSADGNISSVTVNVPKVTQIGVSAGANPTFFDGQAAAEAFDRNRVMIKAVFSDGSAVQVNGEIGTPVPSDDGIYGALDVPVSYGGYSNNLRIYNYFVPGATLTDNHIPIAEYKDVLLIPGSFSIPSGAEVKPPVEKPTEAPTEAPTEKPTEPPTEAPTEAPTEVPTEAPTEAPTVKPTEVQTEKPTEVSTEINTETVTEAYDEKTSEAQTENKTSELNIIKIIIIIMIIACVTGIIVCTVVIIRTKKK